MNIPTFAAYIDHSRRLRDIYIDIVKNNRITHIRDAEKEGMTKVDCDKNGPYADLIIAAAMMGPASLSDLFITAQVFGNGPKVFVPAAQECFALEQVRPKLTLQDYHQPFPAFVIELPEEYQRKRAINGNKPLCILLYHGSFFLLSAVTWTSGESTIRLLINRPDRTIEQLITAAHGRIWDGSLPTVEGEEEVNESCVRLGVNACLLLTMYGCRHVGYANPSHAERLKRRIKKGNSEADVELRGMAQVFAFEQNVNLYRREGVSKGGQGAGAEMPFHWRAGHIRSQAHGPAFTLRKKIFIAPTMVRADLMAGEAADTIVKYKRGV